MRRRAPWWTIGPTLFNELLVAATRQKVWDGTGNQGVNYDAALGLPNPFGKPGWPYLGGMGFGGNYLFWDNDTNANSAFYSNLDDNATKVKGKHTLTFGFHMRYDQLDMLPQQQYVSGADDWSTKATSLYDPSSSRTSPQALPYTGDDFANFYLGVGEYSAELARNTFYGRQKQFAGYFQDTYRVTPRLTLTLGLRWEYWTPIGVKGNMNNSFSVADHAVVLGTSLQNMYASGATTPAMVNRFQQMGLKFETYQQAGMPQSLLTANKNDFGPRLGFAYRGGGGKTSFVLRGGYSSQYFVIPIGGYAARMRRNAPFQAQFYQSLVQAAYSPDGISNIGMRTVPTMFSGVNDLNAVSTDPSVALQPGSANESFFSLNQPDSQVQSWNMTLEKEVMKETVLRVGYIGNHSAHLEELKQINASNQYLPNTMPTDPHQYDRLLNYQRDTSIPHNRFRWNWIADLPVGRGKPLLGNASGVLNKVVGGWQVTGLGSASSSYFALPSGDFPTGTPVEIYGYKYPIQNCTSGTCYPGYLYWNGYIPSTQINSHNAAGQPNGYEGIPANYQPVAPLIPYGQTALPPNAPVGTNVASFWGTNTVWVPLSNGTVQRTSWTGLAPLQNQYLPSIWQWGLDASLVKNIPIKEHFTFRFQCDFFNVLNHPGNSNGIGSTGILSTQGSGNGPRTLQLSGRLSW